MEVSWEIMYHLRFGPGNLILALGARVMLLRKRMEELALAHS
jgi:hypothetical protein